MGFQKSKKMKKKMIILFLIFSCSGNINEKIIVSLKQSCFNDFKNYEVTKRDKNYILFTDSLNFKILEHNEIEGISTISNNILKKGILNDSMKVKVINLIDCMKAHNIVRLEKNQNNFEVLLNDSEKPMILNLKNE
jgi:hypothetical protein